MLKIEDFISDSVEVNHQANSTGNRTCGQRLREIEDHKIRVRKIIVKAGNSKLRWMAENHLKKLYLEEEDIIQFSKNDKRDVLNDKPPIEY